MSLTLCNCTLKTTLTTPAVISDKVKFVVFVPETHSNLIRKAIASAGGGIIGDYKNCSFTTKGIARFTDCSTLSTSTDSIVAVPEERIETVVPITQLKELIEKVRRVHPYKEMGFDVYPLLISRM